MISAPRVLLFVCLLISCGQSENTNTPFKAGVPLGTNKHKDLEEVSGIAVSRRNPGYLWAHNDSGDGPRLYLLDLACKTEREFRLDSAHNRDWEDLTLGPGPIDSISYLYVGDIGDNYNRHPFKYLYRIAEPRMNDDKEVKGVHKFFVRLSDAMRDTEALAYDPLFKKFYLFSKREPQIGLYEIDYPLVSDTLDARRVATLPLRMVVAAGISPDGREILVKNYDKIYYWKREGNESIPALLAKPGLELDYEREPQGESITWAADGSGFYTLSENAHGQRGKLLFYRRK